MRMLELALEIPRNHNKALSLNRPDVNEEKMTPGYWLWSVISFIALTLNIGLSSRKDIQPTKNLATHPHNYDVQNITWFSCS